MVVSGETTQHATTVEESFLDILRFPGCLPIDQNTFVSTPVRASDTVQLATLVVILSFKQATIFYSVGAEVDRVVTADVT